jgi:hypothetical protein
VKEFNYLPLGFASRAYPQILRTVSAKSKELLHMIAPPAAKIQKNFEELVI